MKKFLCALIIFVVVSTSATSFANSTLENIGATILGQILNTVINDALKKNGMGDLIPDEAESADAEAQIPTDNNLPHGTKTSGEVTELSDEQYQSFSEICLAGSIEEFRKKIEYEKISPDAKYTKSDGSVVTLLELAKTSPNPELAEFLESQGTKGE
ncbi:MAG: hypothetical protein IJS40_00805 [Synergistaceae bacterium]|nr:hypothetical protein [Synergistaceae bacterium]